jgi:parallel beta helix pectate lyase-like protein
MIRIIVKLFGVAVALAVCLPVQPASAERVAFVSATGGGTACSQTAPCASIETAVSAVSPDGGRIICMTPVEQDAGFGFNVENIVFDCPSTSWLGGINFFGEGVLKFQHIGFSGLDVATSVIKVTGGGTLIFEDCIVEDIAGPALDIEPNGPLNLVIKNSRISNSSTVAIILKPASGGSINATFDHVTVTKNGGGGIRLDATNGPVTADVTDSVITNNTGNGLNATGGAGAAMLSIHNSVIAKNGAAGVSATGGSGAALIDTTLLDSNASGATSVISGGHILTYGNNRIVGMPGSGFTSTTPLQ